MEEHIGENTSFTDDVEVFPPDIVPPNEASAGNEPSPVPPTAEVQYYSYELDIADTDLIWSVGAPIDTGAVRQYIIDRGYPAISVDAQTDAAGLPTGLLTVKTNPVGTQIYPTVTFSIEDATESNTTAIVTAQVKIADTAIDALPADATFSGTVRFAASIWRSVATGLMGIVPVIEGADGTFVSIGGNDAPAPLYVDIAVSGLVGGTAPTFGLKYRGGTTAGTTYISDVVISGELVDGVEAPGAQITAPHWAAYDGTRFVGLVETTIVWDDTAEGVITPNPDLSRIVALWMFLEANDYEVLLVTGPWNFNTPDEAPVSPTLAIYARSEIDTAISDAFLYSEIGASDLDAFETHWSAVESLTRLSRRVSGGVSIDQYEFSFPAYFVQSGEPTVDVRDDDIWDDTDLTVGSRRFLRVGGVWIEAFDYVVTNEGSVGLGRAIVILNNRVTVIGQNATGSGVGSIAIGRYSVASGTSSGGAGAIAIGNFAVASGLNAIAVGGNSEATNQYAVAFGTNADGKGDYGTALGTESKVTATGGVAIGYFSENSAENATALGRDTTIPVTSPRAIALGYDADVPASTPDAMYVRVNKVRQYRSDSTGSTTYILLSPDGTDGELAVTNTDGLTVNGVAQNLPSASTVTSAMIVDGTIALGDLAAATIASLTNLTVMPIPTGTYISTMDRGMGARDAVTGIALSAGTTYYSPIFIPTGATLDRIGFWVVTGVISTNVRLGIFTMNAATTTATLILDAGTIATGTATSGTMVEVTISQAITNGGWYWLAVRAEGAISGGFVLPTKGFRSNLPTSAIPVPTLVQTGTYIAFGATETMTGVNSRNFILGVRGT